MASARFAVAFCACLALAAVVCAQEPTEEPAEQPTKPVEEPAATVPALPFDPCPVCMAATMAFDKQLDAASNITLTIAQTLAQACEMAGPAKAPCLLFAAQYGGIFAYGLSVAKFSLDGFCPGMFFCPPPTLQMMTQNGLFDTACNVCKGTMQRVLAAMSSEQLAGQVQATIQAICSAPLVDKERCMAVFGVALAQSMETTKALLVPGTICTLLGPCAIAAPAAPVPSPVPVAASNVVV